MDNTNNNNNSINADSTKKDDSVAIPPGDNPIANAAAVVSSEINAQNSDATMPPSLFRTSSENTPKTSEAGSVNTASATSTNDMFSQFAQKIIKEQEGIIGPIAYEQASKVAGLTIDPTTRAVTLVGDKKTILENLVKQYELLFGRVSIEICKEAIRSDIATAPRDQIPQVLL